MKKNRVKFTGRYSKALFWVIILLIIILAINIRILQSSRNDRIEADGQVRLSSIASRVGNSLYRSECLLDSVAMQVEQLISAGGSIPERLQSHFSPETIEDICSRSGGSCFSAYAAYDGQLYIHDFVPDDDFVLDERSWYIGAKRRMGAVNVTEPYIDASTGQMCYTISKLLSDGSTVVGLDFTLNEIQKYIEEMSENGSGTSLIVNDDGTIVGHSQHEYVGMDYSQLDFCNELVNKVFMLNGGSFDYSADGVKYNVFSAKTNYDWYLIVCVKSGEANAVINDTELIILIVMIVLAAAVAVLFAYMCRKRAAAENALSAKDEHLKKVAEELQHPISMIMNRAEILSSSAEDGSSAGAEISSIAKELNRTLEDSISDNSSENAHSRSDKDTADEKNPVKRSKKMVVLTVLINVVLVATAVFTIVYDTVSETLMGNVEMQKEANIYVSQVKEWALTNKTVLDVISESITAQPGFADDYDSAIAYLDSLVSKHEDISVAYICNPEWEHTVFMNNGWEPDENWHVEERQWYIDTIASKDNFSISAPYLDEQTRLYCITLSKIVYDEKGNFIGVLGIDYYLDKLIGILGESYTDLGYAFITDVDGNIINHPKEEYQMKSDSSVNAADLYYREALLRIDHFQSIFIDYDSEWKACYVSKEEISGFNVFVVKDFDDVYERTYYSLGILITLFTACIIIVNVIILSLTAWQTRVNKKLKEAADNAISAGKAKNDFLANMSHEIRTPINAVLGMNEMIIRESHEKQIVEYAANIQSAGRTLLSIINEILDFSKIESGKMEIVPVEYDISSLVNDIINMIKARAEKKNLRFIPEIDEKIPSVLYGDDVRLRQIITNLLTNAVKYTPEGYVRLRMTVLRIEDGVLRLEVSVSDTGMGIKEEDMDKLFTSFQRLDQEKNRSIEGTGLGITIVSRLLEMMGSELSVSSVYGAGSTFSFVVEQKIINPEPMGDYEARFKASAENISESASKTAPDVRILVVDDNETNLLVAKNLLKRTLAKVETADSGKKCIELLSENMYDIVFLDHMMPEMDGIETLRRIKEEELAVGTVFIALTANAIHGAKQTYLEAGFDDYLSKPFSGHDIERCLFSHISRDMIKFAENDESIPEENAEQADDIGSELDIEKALANLDGDTDAYMNAVYEFCDSNRSNDLELDYNFKDHKSYRINLKKARDEAEKAGLYELSELADRLIAAVNDRDDSYLAANHGSFIKMYRRAAENLEKTANEYFS